MPISVDSIGGDGCVLLLPFNEGSGTTTYDYSGYNAIAAPTLRASPQGSDTTAYDYSGYNNNGTIYNATWTPTPHGSGLYFNGNNAYVAVPDSPSLDITDEITVEAWVNVDNSASGDFQTIVTKWYDGSSVPGQSFFLGFGIDTKSRFSVTTNIGNKQVYGPYLTKSKWYHLVGTYDGSTIKLYVNGDLVKSDILSGQILINPQPVGIGARIYDGGFWGYAFNGLIDEVRIYNRALSEEEIQAHFRGARLLPLRGD